MQWADRGGRVTATRHCYMYVPVLHSKIEKVERDRFDSCRHTCSYVAPILSCLSAMFSGNVSIKDGPPHALTGHTVTI